MERVWRRLGRYESNGNAYCAWVCATHEPGGRETWKEGEDWQSGAPMPKPKWIRLELPRWLPIIRPKRNTDIFGQVLRQFVGATKAEGIVICSEAWMKQYGDGKDPNFDSDKAKRLRAEDPEDLGKAPGAQEALFMNLEHIAVGRRAWRAMIRRNPTKLESWEMLDMTQSPVGDNLTGIVNVGT